MFSAFSVKSEIKESFLFCHDIDTAVFFVSTSPLFKFFLFLYVLAQECNAVGFFSVKKPKNVQNENENTGKFTFKASPSHNFSLVLNNTI